MNEMTCSSCREPKYRLKAVQSKLLPKQRIYLCTDCFDKGFEPRTYIILAAQSFGPQYTADHVKNHKYVGEPIHLKEMIK